LITQLWPQIIEMWINQIF